MFGPHLPCFHGLSNWKGAPPYRPISSPKFPIRGFIVLFFEKLFTYTMLVWVLKQGDVGKFQII